MTKELVLDEKTIRVGFGKYYERYEYLRRYGKKYIEKNDIEELKRLWEELETLERIVKAIKTISRG
ncbi:MAG: hypothetical protein N3C61_00815 [Candidatus Micrarchaeota archaeon]|nr:hypothetical protein [Candidatus Micrarchaeota archaeon]